VGQVCVIGVINEVGWVGVEKRERVWCEKGSVFVKC